MPSSLLGFLTEPKAQQHKLVKLCIPGTVENITIRELRAVWGVCWYSRETLRPKDLLGVYARSTCPSPALNTNAAPPLQEDFTNLTGNVGNPFHQSVGHFETCFAAWMEEKELFTFWEVASFPPFTAGSSPPVVLAGHPSLSQGVSRERGRNHIPPALNPRPSSQNLP